MPKILVVDDEFSLRALYRDDLEREGYAVVTAGSGPEGILAIDREHPDLVVLDVCLPGMDGLDTMSRILDLNPTMPIVLNTAYSKYCHNFAAWSADACLVKKGDTSELRATIREILDSTG